MAAAPITDSQRLDRHQLRALVRFSIKRAWRGTTNPFNAMQKRTAKIPGLALVLVMNLVFSMLFGITFHLLHDLFAGLVIGGIGAIVIVSVQVLMEYSHIIITPDDYHIIIPHPVSSKTFYTSKLIHFLLFVAALSTAVSFFPALTAAISLGSVIAFPVVLIHFLISNLFCAMLMVSVFTLAIRMFNRHTMERVLGYIQIVFFVCMYMGYSMAFAEIRNILQGVDVLHMRWFMISPTYWFAAPVRLIADGWHTPSAILFAVGTALLLILGRFVTARLSLSYAESLAEEGSVKQTVRQSRSIPILSTLWRWYSRPEDRAVLMLLRAQFKHDLRFRMGVIWLVPYIIIAIIYETWQGYVQRDPLAMSSDSATDPGVLMPMAISLMPFVFHAAIRSSKYWQAAWILHATPVDRVRLVLTAKRLITVLFVLPFGVYFCGVCYYLYGNLLHAVMHTIFVVIISLIGLTLLNLLSAGLPFADDNPYGNFTASMSAMVPVMIVLVIPLMIIAYNGYGGYLGWAIVTGIAILFNLILVGAQNRRIRAQVKTWEFTA